MSAVALTAEERTVLELFLRDGGRAGEILHAQIEQAKVVSRGSTSTGFHADLEVAAGCARLAGSPSFRLAGVSMRVDVSSGSVGFALLVEDGALSQLEGFAFGDDAWPQRIDPAALFYDELREEDSLRLRSMGCGDERAPDV